MNPVQARQIAEHGLRIERIESVQTECLTECTRDEAAAAGGRGVVPAAAIPNSTKHDKARAVGRAGVPAAR